MRPSTAAPSRMVKTTTPMPSLNRLSAAMVVFSSLGAANLLSRAITATGSVGLIRAPNTRHQMKGASMPNRPVSSLKPAATTTVETTTPTVDSTAISHLPRLR